MKQYFAGLLFYPHFLILFIFEMLYNTVF